jgi:hypothetical protein
VQFVRINRELQNGDILMKPAMNVSFRDLARRDAASSAVLERYSNQRLRLALGPFRRRVRHVEAILRDLNGPRGGVDNSCTVRIHLDPSDLLVVEGRADSPHAAIAEATRRAESAVRRRLRRRRALARSRYVRSTVAA